MNKNIILAIGAVAVVAGVGYVATKKDRIPFPPELEKERQAAEAEWKKMHEDETPWVKAVQSSSDCPECSNAVNNINNVANKRNGIYEAHGVLFQLRVPA